MPPLSVDQVSDMLIGIRHDRKLLEQYLHQLANNENREISLLAVLTLLEDRDETIRADAMWMISMLIQRDHIAAPALLRAVKDQNKYVWSQATVLLAEHDLAYMADELVKVLRDTSLYPQTRARAASSLARSNQVDAIPDLIDALDDEDPDIVWNVIHVLSKFDRKEPMLLPAVTKLRIIASADQRCTAAGSSLSEEAWRTIRSIEGREA